jgi:hypothetical protein
MNSLEKEFVPYEQALELKELGFNEPCFMQWTYAPKLIPCICDWGKLTPKTNQESYYGSIGDCISAPTFSQAFRWFREKYNLKDKYGVFPHHTIMFNYIIGGGKEEEAELGCLLKLIEIVKEKKNG